MRAKPHSKKQAAARAALAMSPEEEWAANIERRLLGSCHPFQLDAVLDPSLLISYLVGRGGAKTTSMRARAVRKITQRKRARVTYTATSRPEAEKLNWEPLKQLIDELGEMDNFEFKEAKLTCICKKTGGMYSLVGADDKGEVNKLRGQPYDEFQLDETASFPIPLVENIVDQAVGPRLGERDGVFLMGGTPGLILRGRFYEVTRMGSESHRPYRLRGADEYAGWTNWSSHAWNMLDIMALPDCRERYLPLVKNWERALLTKKNNQWSDDNPIWMREYLGLWAQDDTTNMYAYKAHKDGALFNRWEPYGSRKLEGLQALKAAIAALPADFKDPLYGYGMDLGARDPLALTIKAFSPTDELRRIYHVFSFEKRGMYPSSIADMLIGTEAADMARRGQVYSNPGGLFGLTGWPVAFVADLAGLGEAIILELAEVYGIKIKAAQKKDKPGAIEVYSGHLVDGRMFVLGDSPLEQQLTTLQWKPDEYGNLKEDKAIANHSADSATYITTEIGTMFSAAPPEPKNADARAPRPNDKKKTPTKPDAWNDQPTARKRRGEFDALLSESDPWQGGPWGDE